MMLDPAVNLMFERMKKEVELCKEKLEQAQNDLAAWKFSPDRCVSCIHLPLIALMKKSKHKMCCFKEQLITRNNYDC